jgi:hypothetical protein
VHLAISSAEREALNGVRNVQTRIKLEHERSCGLYFKKAAGHSLAGDELSVCWLIVRLASLACFAHWHARSYRPATKWARAIALFIT